MANLTRLGFLATAVVFHLVYILSIFDIYFVSPIVSGMRLYGVEREAPAKAPADRLVLFVGKIAPPSPLGAVVLCQVNTLMHRRWTTSRQGTPVASRALS